MPFKIIYKTDLIFFFQIARDISNFLLLINFFLNNRKI